MLGNIAQRFFTWLSRFKSEIWLMKLHYLLYWGGAGCTGHFIVLIGKDVGLDATSLGVIGSIFSIGLIFSQPCFGVICDRFKNDTYVMLFIVITAGTSLFSLIWIPPLQLSESIGEKYERCRNINVTENEICFTFNQSHWLENGDCNLTNLLNQQFMNSTIYSTILSTNETEPEPFQNNEYYLGNSNVSLFNNSDISKYNTVASGCFKFKNKEDTYRIYYMWLFSIVAIIANVLLFSGFSLSDSLCQRILGDDKSSQFGSCKFWSSCSFGITALAAGITNDAPAIKKYTVGFFIMLVAFTVDGILLCKVPVPESNSARFQLKHMKQAFASKEILLFTIATLLIGLLTALSWQYQFLFLQSIGASQTLLGFISVWQYVFADPLFYALSGIILQKTGYTLCLVISFLGFALRFLILSFIANPWYAFIPEFFEGITFALFLVNMVTFSKEKAPDGMAHTLIGVFFTYFQGIGLSCGSLLFGLGFDHLGMQLTYHVASGTSFIFAVCFLVTKMTTKIKEVKIMES